MIRFERRVHWFIAAAVVLAACDKGGGSTSASAKAEDTAASSSKKASSTSSAANKAGSATAAATTAVPKDEGVAITKHYPAVGDKETNHQEEDSELKGEVKGPKGSIQIDSTEHAVTDKVEECLEVGDHTCKKLKVTYTKAESTEKNEGKDSGGPKPTNGKTYIVEQKDGAAEITLDGGGTPSPAELKELASYKQVGKDKKLLDALPDKVKVGDSLDELAKILGELASHDDEDKPTITSKMVVKEIKDVGGKKIIVFDTHMLMEGESKKLGHMKIEMNGTFELRADGGHPVNATFDGPLSFKLDGDAGSLNGKTAIKETATYSW